MKRITIEANARETLGKVNTKLLRKEERIPCVLYGGKENVHFSVGKNEMRKLVYTDKVYLVDLDIDGKKCLAYQKEIQFHPVTDNILHVDFYEVTESKPITVKVPVILNGLAKGVGEGGKLSLEHRRLSVKALAKDLPDQFDIDVTDLALGKTIQVGDLNFEGLQLVDPKNWVVASVKLTRVAKGMEGDEEEEGEEGEEGAEGEAKEGEDEKAAE